MKRIVQLWFVLALAMGMASTPAVRAMDPEEEGDKPAAAASAAGMNMLEESLNQESQSAGQDPTGKELPNMGLALFDAEAPGSRIGKALDSVPPQDKDMILKSALDKIGFFAAKGGSRLASIAGTIEGIQHENMYRLILQALGEGAQGLTYVQKSALQHQFLGYEVYYKDEVKKDAWLGSFSKVWAPEAGGGLLAFINNTYQEITAETEAIDTYHYRVVRHSQLAGLNYHINGLLPTDADGPQPTVVLDIDAPRPKFNMDENKLPKRLRNLVLTNADESVQTIESGFLMCNKFLQALHLNVPALKCAKEDLLSGCERLTTFILNAPRLVTVGGYFLARNDALNNVYLNVPRLKSAGYYFLAKNAALDDPFLVMPALKTFGYFFLSENNVLKNAHLVMPTLKTIGPSFLYKNEALETVHLDLPVLENVELYPLFFCPNISSILVPVDQLERLRNLFPKKERGLLASTFACEL